MQPNTSKCITNSSMLFHISWKAKRQHRLMGSYIFEIDIVHVSIPSTNMYLFVQCNPLVNKLLTSFRLIYTSICVISHEFTHENPYSSMTHIFTINLLVNMNLYLENYGMSQVVLLLQEYAHGRGHFSLWSSFSSWS